MSITRAQRARFHDYAPTPEDIEAVMLALDTATERLSNERTKRSWAESRATRAEAQSAIRGLAITYARERTRAAEARLDQLQAAHRDAISHARRIIAHPDRWIAQDLVDATSNMLSALKGAPTIKGGAVQWKQAADEAEARSKALAEDVAHIDALYEQEQSRIQAVEHLLDKTDSMFVGAISAEHRAILISKVRRALDVP